MRSSVVVPQVLITNLFTYTNKLDSESTYASKCLGCARRVSRGRGRAVRAAASPARLPRRTRSKRR